MTLFIGALEQLSVAQEINQQEPPAPLSPSIDQKSPSLGAVIFVWTLWLPCHRCRSAGTWQQGRSACIGLCECLPGATALVQGKREQRVLQCGGGHDGLLQDEPFNVLWGHEQTGLAGLLLSAILTLRKNRVLVMIFA